MRAPRILSVPLLAALALHLGGCERPDAQVQLETRTFTLTYLDPQDAGQLVGPYVYRNRDGAPGRISVAHDAPAISVRETPDNLNRIAEALAQVDQPPANPSTRLRFLLVKANGTDEHDPRIADVETELRKVLRFDGYTVAGEGVVTVAGAQETKYSQSIYVAANDRYHTITGTYEQGNLHIQFGELYTVVSVSPGRTVVVGSVPIFQYLDENGQPITSTYLLVVRAAGT